MSEGPQQRNNGTRTSAREAEYGLARREKAEVVERLRGFSNSYDDVFLLTGPADSGKTVLVKDLLAELPPEVPAVVLAAADLKEDGLLKSLCQQLGLPGWPGDWEMTMSKIAASLRPHEHAFLVIDNAHKLPAAAFDDIRFLTYLRSGRGPLLQTILVGREKLLNEIEASEIGRLGIWQIQRGQLRLPRDIALYAVEGAVAAEDVKGPDVDATDVPIATAEAPSVSVATGQEEQAGTGDATIRGEIESAPGSQPEPSAAAEVPDQRQAAESLPVLPAPQAAAASDAAPSEVGTAGFTRHLAKVALLLVVAGAVYWYAQGDSDAPAAPAPLATEPERQPSALPAAGTGAPVESAAPAIAEIAQQAPTGSGEALLMESQVAAEVDISTAAAGDSEYPLEVIPPSPEQTEPPAVAVVARAAEEAVGIDKVDALLAAAKEAIGRDFLRTPMQQSAWKYYNQVLLLQPDNQAARQGMQDIVDRYVVLIRLAIERDKLLAAQTYLARGLAVAADHRGLYAMESELKLALARQESREGSAEPSAAGLEPVEAGQEVSTGTR